MHGRPNKREKKIHRQQALHLTLPEVGFPRRVPGPHVSEILFQRVQVELYGRPFGAFDPDYIQSCLRQCSAAEKFGGASEPLRCEYIGVLLSNV